MEKKEKKQNRKNRREISPRSPHDFHRRVQRLFGSRLTCETNLEFPRYIREDEWIYMEEIESKLSDEEIEVKIKRLRKAFGKLEEDTFSIPKQICFRGQGCILRHSLPHLQEFYHLDELQSEQKLNTATELRLSDEFKSFSSKKENHLAISPIKSKNWGLKKSSEDDYNSNSQPSGYNKATLFKGSYSIVSESSIKASNANENEKAEVNELIARFSPQALRQFILDIAFEKNPNIIEKLRKFPRELLGESIIGEKDKIYRWNDIFQKTIEAIRKLSPNTRQEERIKVYEELAHHSHDFIYTATTYGKIIISEVYLPPEEKTIKPIRGGLAGGEKYVCKGIYFKFAVNAHNLFDSENSANKVAGHELKSLNQLFGLCLIPEFQDLHFPMMILIDYRGFRLSAMSILPINEYTIIYGSSDAGREIHTDSARMGEKLKSIAKKFNLQEHRVGNSNLPKTLWTPVDLEAHYGFDKRFYLLDFSRLFPPVNPDKQKSSYLFKLFRAEFVKQYHLPLSSDAFSPFVKNQNEAKHNKDVEEATIYLKTRTIPEFAEKLKNLSRKHSLTQSLHLNGINVRYLGLVRACLTDDTEEEKYWRFMLLLEMLARTLKQKIRLILRREMRNLRQSGEDPYKGVIIKYLNKVFGNVPESDEYWKKKLKGSLQKKFEGALSEIEKEPDFPLKERISQSVVGLPDGKCLLFSLIQKKAGLIFTSTTDRAFKENPEVFKFQQPLDETDLIAFELQVKQMNIAQHSEAFTIKLKASKRTGEESQRLYKLAIEKFTTALDSMPNNKVTLRNLADCYSYIGDIEQAENYYTQAIKTDKKDTNTLFKYACFQEKQSHFDQAEEYYLKSLEANHFYSNCLTVYADFLVSCRKKYELANILYSCAIAADRTNSYALNNYACFLTFIEDFKNYDKAEECFKRAIQINSEHSVHLQNYGLFMEVIRENTVQAHQLLKKSQEMEQKNLMRSISISSTDDSSESMNEDQSSLTRAQKRNQRRRRTKHKIRQVQKDKILEYDPYENSDEDIEWSPSEFRRRR